MEWAQKVAEASVVTRPTRSSPRSTRAVSSSRTCWSIVDGTMPVRTVHATRGKYQRAEPVAGFYEQGRVHHVGCHAALEDQMCSFAPDIDRHRQGSPDRVDALVWGLTELMVQFRDRRPARVRTARIG